MLENISSDTWSFMSKQDLKICLFSQEVTLENICLVFQAPLSHYQRGTFLVGWRNWSLSSRPGLSGRAQDVRIMASTSAFLRHLLLDKISKSGLWHSTNTFCSTVTLLTSGWYFVLLLVCRSQRRIAQTGSFVVNGTSLLYFCLCFSYSFAFF